MLRSVINYTVRSFRKRDTFQISILTSSEYSYSRFASRKKNVIKEKNEYVASEKLDCSETKFSLKVGLHHTDLSEKVLQLESADESIRNKEKTNKTLIKPKVTFTALKENDNILISTLSATKNRKMREKNNLILLEGYRLIEDAIKAGEIPEKIFFNNTYDLNRLKIPSETKLYKVPYRSLKTWSDLTTSPGIMAIFRTPNINEIASADDTLPITIICDNVREPGNLGSILRAAAAAGCMKVILTQDLWNTKVLRGAAGAHFRIPIYKDVRIDDVLNHIENESNIYLADNKTFTNEGSFPKSEDDMHQNNDPKNALAKKKEDREILEKQLLDIPVLPYFKVDFVQSSIVLIISGETEGLSSETIQFILEKKGKRINIPLTNDVESLNNSMAFGILTFEIRRQFLKLQSALE
ncbi:rRNA methyltransferase 3A, mitochondrial isoform X2 [Prorops nasuta]|uniref:rRNA methyltransferase 3A, mitochondrial isoform X2 n=1 Tax=Prorops nasuta TaxID=863751 RepID=UPI0034CE5D51